MYGRKYDSFSSQSLPLPANSRHHRRSCKILAGHLFLRCLALLGLLFLAERMFFPYDWSQHLHASTTNGTLEQTVNHLYRSKDAVTASMTRVTQTAVHDKAIIASALKDDNTTWITDHLHGWDTNIYIMDDADANVTVAKQKGREAAAYLTYLITHYHNLPEHMVFIHAQRYQWHNDDMMFDHLTNLLNLKLGTVTKRGYTSLRCAWDPGCPVGVKPDKDHRDGYFEWSGEYAKAWADFFPNEAVPDSVGHPCCAQFAVTRDQVRQRPVQFYERIRQWLWDSELDPQKTGRILEYSWHKFFGQNATSCPNTQACYCDLYGYCDLKCPKQGSCKNRAWSLRWDQMNLPKDWPDKGQGQNGLPQWGWWLPGGSRAFRSKTAMNMKKVDGNWQYGYLASAPSSLPQ